MFKNILKQLSQDKPCRRCQELQEEIDLLRARHRAQKKRANKNARRIAEVERLREHGF